MSDLIGFESPKIDWTPGPDLPQRFKRFRQKCELLFNGPLKARTNEQRCRYVLLWTGDYGLDLLNTRNLSSEEQNKLDEYWTRFEEHVKPQSNLIFNQTLLSPKPEAKRTTPRFPERGQAIDSKQWLFVQTPRRMTERRSRVWR